ncbi:MAG: multicopper oxidase domain-containing protein [Baekduia sp.]
MDREITRRRLLRAGGTAALTALGGGLMTRGASGAANPFTTFISPQLRRYVTELPRIPAQAAGGRLTAAASTHRFHPDLPLDVTWGYNGQSYLGPVLEARRGVTGRIEAVNALGAHRFARDIDPTVHGASALDRTKPRHVVHLHGGVTDPEFDGHPLRTRRPGGSHGHVYRNRQDAAMLWYHDHSIGITRMNVHAGLAGAYLLRDDYDTGAAGNPLGLPSGLQELTLVLQDKTFSADGRMMMRSVTFVPEGMWEGAQAGDVAVVNGAVWPDCSVDRTLYRLRLLNASNTRTYRLRFANGMRFFVIGGDQGLLNAPVPVTGLRVAAGERYDVLADFSGLRQNESVVLQNLERLPVQFQVIGDAEIPEVMRFTARSRVARSRPVPDRLRGGSPRRPPELRQFGAPVLTRNMTVGQIWDQTRFPPFEMNLNNLRFDTADVERPRAGTVEQWNIINTTTDEHPIHVHLAGIRVLERRPYDAVWYLLFNPRPATGVRWAPPADRFANGPALPPAPAEQGDKDTVWCPAGHITRLLVRWPGVNELGFDPDRPFAVPSTVEDGAPGIDDKSGQTLVCRLSDQTQPSADRARGYVWHCHVIDHEDHEMMLPLRVVTGS